MRVVENDTTPETSYAQEVYRPADEQKAARTVTIADIWEAHKFLKPRLHHTPLAPSRTLRELTGADVRHAIRDPERGHDLLLQRHQQFVLLPRRIR